MPSMGRFIQGALGRGKGGGASEQAVAAAVVEAVLNDAATILAMQQKIQAFLTAQGVGVGVQAIAGLGSPLGRFKPTGVDFDFALEAAGGPTAPAWGTVPQDAVAIEMWSNGSAADDYIFWSTRSGQLSNAGVIATNISNNNGATNPNKVLANGERIVLPLSVVGVVDASFRFAGGKSTSRLQGRYISANSTFPYSLASAEENVLVGAGASQQFAYSNTNKFPATTTALAIQIKGTQGVRVKYDGVLPTATVGDLLPPGNYYLDMSRQGIALSALRMYVPTGAWIISNALKASQ